MIIFFTNCSSHKGSYRGIFYTDISDHFPIFYINSINKLSDIDKDFLIKRDYSEQNIDKFKNYLTNIDWLPVITVEDPQIAYARFNDIFSLGYNQCFPLKKIKLGYKNRKPWLSEGLKTSIKIKNKLFIKYKCNSTPQNEAKYKEYRNKVNSLIRKAERKHYETLLETNKNDLKKSWKILKEVINKKSSSVLPEFILSGDDKLTDKSSIADAFNQFYTNIGPTLAKKIGNVNLNPLSYIKHSCSSSIFLDPVTESELVELITNLKMSSPGWDNFNTKIIKSVYLLFLNPLNHIFNLSLKHGVFPDELKMAKVIPLFKTGDKCLVANYRPVSVLPVFSKLLERIMYNRLIKYVDCNNLLYKYQFGFRKNHSTVMALTTLTDKISNAVEDGDYVMGVFLDFSKAFDTVNHCILLDKLHLYGIRGAAHQWISSYLSNRKQCVNFDGAMSQPMSITCGVPQGSILGPLLFLLYINDIVNVSDKLFPILFADDTNVFINGKCIDSMSVLMNNELCKLLLWLNANTLSLIVKKTHFIIFYSRHKKEPLRNKY